MFLHLSFAAFLIQRLLNTDLSIGFVFAGVFMLFCLKHQPLQSLLDHLGIICVSMVLSVAFFNTILRREITSITISFVLLIGLLISVRLLDLNRIGRSGSTSSQTSSYKSSVLLSFAAMAFLIGRVKAVENFNTQWWILSV